MSIPSVEELFASAAKYPSVKFPTVGSQFHGIVESQETAQQREYNPDGPGDLRFWPDGRPMLQVILTCQDASTGETVKLYVKGKMLQAAKQAVLQAGLKSFVPGTHIMVEHTGVAANRAKEYSVQVSLPIPDAAEATPEVTPAAKPEATPAAKSEAAPTDSGLSPEAVEALRKAGLIG